jgi:hypothetical protein
LLLEATMITLRCTKKLLTHLGGRPEFDDHEPTALLGDWYANLVAMPAGPPFFLLMNERSLLSVVLPYDADLLPGFRRRAVALLRRLGLPAEAVEREAFHLQKIRLGKTKNRRVLGTMNDAAWNLESMLFDGPRGQFTLDRAEEQLAATPFSVIHYQVAADVARELLGVPPRGQPLQYEHLAFRPR